MTKTFGELVLEARLARRMSQEDLAELVGTSQQTIQKIESGEIKRTGFAAEIAAILDISIPLKKMPILIDPNVQQHVLFNKAELIADRDLPIYASARGGSRHDSMIVSTDAIDYTKRPAPLVGVRDGYGIYVIGDSMSPAFEHADLALVHPHLPARHGDDVVLYGAASDGSHFALIKQLLRASQTEWHLRQHNPPEGEAKDFRLAREEWQVCHVVVGRYRRR